jgi:hypothetical protein
MGWVMSIYNAGTHDEDINDDMLNEIIFRIPNFKYIGSGLGGFFASDNLLLVS